MSRSHTDIRNNLVSPILLPKQDDSKNDSISIHLAFQDGETAPTADKGCSEQFPEPDAIRERLAATIRTQASPEYRPKANGCLSLPLEF